MLFILVMNMLEHMFSKAAEEMVLHQSVDDVVLFIHLKEGDISQWTFYVSLMLHHVSRQISRTVMC
jgi:hypothetical protein